MQGFVLRIKCASRCSAPHMSEEASPRPTSSSRGTGNGSSIPRSAQLPAYQAMRLGIANLDNEERASKKDDD